MHTDIFDNQSELARLLHSIDEAYEAAQSGLDGPAVVGPHRRRTSCTEAIAHAFEHLHPLIGGPQRAMQLLDEHLNTREKERDERERRVRTTNQQPAGIHNDHIPSHDASVPFTPGADTVPADRASRVHDDHHTHRCSLVLASGPILAHARS